VQELGQELAVLTGDAGDERTGHEAQIVPGGTVAAVVTVAMDVGPLVGPRTGIGHFVAQLLDALADLPEPPDIERYVLSFRASLPPGVRRLPYPAGPTLRAWGRVDWPRARRSLGDVDVVHGTNYVVPPSGRPSIVTIHDCSFVTRPDLVNATVRSFVPIARRAIAAGAWVHTPSSFVAEQVRDLLGASRIRVIPHGPPGRLDTSATPFAARPYVLALATLEPRKNLVRLVDAFGVAHAAHPDLGLVLAGPDGADRPAIDAAIARLAPTARSRVVLPGWLDDERRAGALAGAAVLAYPSLDEGFGLPLLEAMRFGVPIVAARAGAIPEVAGDAARLVDPFDTDALAAALADVIGDDVHRRTLVAAGRARVQDFSWERSASEFVALYREAAMERAAT
jgi:glycosyltransferase involved in cell wall biosynthesis